MQLLHKTLLPTNCNFKKSSFFFFSVLLFSSNFIHSYSSPHSVVLNNLVSLFYLSCPPFLVSLSSSTSWMDSFTVFSLLSSMMIPPVSERLVSLFWFQTHTKLLFGLRRFLNVVKHHLMFLYVWNGGKHCSFLVKLGKIDLGWQCSCQSKFSNQGLYPSLAFFLSLL